MKVTLWINFVLLGAALCAGSALAANQKATPTGEKSGDAAASMGDKDGCPVHERAMGRLHKDGEPCPYMKNMGKEHEGCDVRDKKDCLESRGEPCRVRHDMQHTSALHEACDPAKAAAKDTK